MKSRAISVGLPRYNNSRDAFIAVAGAGGGGANRQILARILPPLICTTMNWRTSLLGLGVPELLRRL